MTAIDFTLEASNGRAFPVFLSSTMLSLAISRFAAYEEAAGTHASPSENTARSTSIKYSNAKQSKVIRHPINQHSSNH